MKVAFTVPGPLVSANRASRVVNNRAVKSAEKRRDEARVASLALAARVQQDWKQPAYSSMTSLAIGSRLDCDNIAKVIGDGIQGVLIANDRTVRRVLVAKMDGKPERYEVSLEEMER